MQLEKISGGDGRKGEWWKTKYNKIFGLNSIHGYIYIYYVGDDCPIPRREKCK